MNRRNQMIGLAILTAITMIGQYVLLGNSVLGGIKTDLPTWFNGVEKSLWAFRAFVEILVIVYIGVTTSESKNVRVILWAFKVVLIVLVITTVGPVFAEYSIGKPMIELFGQTSVIVWSFLLAGISATMLAGVSYAYKTQPFDIEVQDLEYELQEATNTVAGLMDELQQLKLEKQGFNNAVQFLQLLPPTAVVQLLARFSDTKLDAAEVAESTGLAISTVRSAMSRAKNGE